MLHWKYFALISASYIQINLEINLWPIRNYHAQSSTATAAAAPPVPHRTVQSTNQCLFLMQSASMVCKMVLYKTIFTILYSNNLKYTHKLHNTYMILVYCTIIYNTYIYEYIRIWTECKVAIGQKFISKAHCSACAFTVYTIKYSLPL